MSDSHEMKVIIGSAIKGLTEILSRFELAAIPRTEKGVAGFIDYVFDAIADNYPPATGALLKQMYHPDKKSHVRHNLLFEEKLLEDGITSDRFIKPGNPYNMKSKRGDGKGSPGLIEMIILGSQGVPETCDMFVIVDNELAMGLDDSDGIKKDYFPLSLRMAIFHEIAAHAGLYKTTIDAMGVQRFSSMAQKHNDEMSALHEMFAVIIDKFLIDRIPQEMADAEIRKMRPQLAAVMKARDIIMRARPMADLVKLPHRSEGSDLSPEHLDMIKRYLGNYISPSTGTGTPGTL